MSDATQPPFSRLRLWCGRIVLAMLIAFSTLLTFGYIASGTRQTGNLDQLLDLQQPVAILLSKAGEGLVYWVAVVAFVLRKPTPLIVSAAASSCLLAWDVIADALTPGFQLRYLANHLDIAIPWFLVLLLAIVLLVPSNLHKRGG